MKIYKINIKKLLLIPSLTIAICCMSGCNNSTATISNSQEKTYKEAINLYDNGKYESALHNFSELNNYMDSKSYAEKCNYQIAIKYLENNSYELAEPYINQIKKIDVSALKTVYNYQKAVNLYTSGDKKTAVKLFCKVSDYEDAASYIAQYTKLLLKKNKYKDVINLLDGLNYNEQLAKYTEKAKLGIKYERISKDIGTVNWGDYEIIDNPIEIEESLKSFFYGTRINCEDKNDKLHISKYEINGRQYGVYSYCLLEMDEVMIFYYLDEPDKLYALASGPFVADFSEEAMKYRMFRTYYMNDFTTKTNGVGCDATYYNLSPETVKMVYDMDSNAAKQIEEDVKENNIISDDITPESIYNAAKSDFKQYIIKEYTNVFVYSWFQYTYPDISNVNISNNNGKYNISFQAIVDKEPLDLLERSKEIYNVIAQYDINNGNIEQVSFSAAKN